MTTQAVAYQIAGDLTPHEVCRFSVNPDGVVIASNDCPSARMVLTRTIVEQPAGQPLTPKDGLRFLKFLPYAYAGSRFRVVLEDTGNGEQEPDKAEDKLPDSQCSARPDATHDATTAATESPSKPSRR